MLSKCDECGKDYEVEFQTAEVDEGVFKTFFVCPHCEHEYVAYLKNDSVRDKQADINRMHARLRKKGLGQIQKQKLMFGIKKKENAVKSEMDALKEMYL